VFLSEPRAVQDQKQSFSSGLPCEISLPFAREDLNLNIFVAATAAAMRQYIVTSSMLKSIISTSIIITTTTIFPTL